MATSHEEQIREALRILDGCDWTKVPASGAESCDEAGPGEKLVRRVKGLVGDCHEATGRLERLQREFAVFREVNADANRMLEKKIEEISLFRLITDTTSRAILTQNPFKLILDQVITIAGAENGSIMLHNGEAGRLEVRTASGQEELSPDDPLFKVTEQIAGRVVASGKPYLVNDISADSHFAFSPDSTYGIGSLASFPLMIENRTVGVLNLSSPHIGAFGTETERIMHIMAGQIAVAVENARLYGEVRKTKEYLENLVDKAGDAIFTLDRTHRIVSWNTGAEVIFRRDKGSVLGKAACDLVPENVSPTLREKIKNVLDSESIVTIEIDAARGDGQVTQIALTLSPIRGAEGDVVGVSGIAKDITKQRQAEEELRQLNEAKANFVSTVSHELRTPLTSIKSLTEVLLHEGASLPEENIGKYLNVINEECDRLSGLISSLLDLQKLNTGKLDVKFERVVLADVVRQATELFDGLGFQNRVELSTEFLAADDATTVMGDRERLMQILSNLLSNALKYTGAGGRVCLRLDREDGNVRLTVTDNGIGIPNGDKDKVFEKFYQVDHPVIRRKGGTGLGLAITKELVVLHGGQIWVESEGENGCSFHVTIPAGE